MGDFPSIVVPKLGGGMVIAVVALVHVVLAHYAVGTGFLLYGLEKADPTGKQAGIQRALKLLGWTVIYVNFVVGAITGVGIWITISLFSTEATQFLIQKFVWLWATEWTFFVVEIVVGYLYYYRREHLPWPARKRLALIYLVFTWGSLLVITGILSFMLTSRDGNAIVGWLNASVWPSVAMRTLSAVTLSCLTLLVVVNIPVLFPFPRDSEERGAVAQVVYKALVWFFLLLPLALWYRLTLPAAHAEYAEGSSVPISMFLASAAIFSALVTVVSWYAYRKERRLQLEAAVMLLIMGVLATFSAEFVREGIRKPYIIEPMLYSNGFWVKDIPEWQRQAAAAGSVLDVRTLYPGTDHEQAVGKWIVPPVTDASKPVDRGEAIYRAECMICHEWDGFNGLKPLTRAWDNRAYATEIVRNLNNARPYMPPFVGTERDVNDLVTYIQSLRKGGDHAAH